MSSRSCPGPRLPVSPGLSLPHGSVLRRRSPSTVPPRVPTARASRGEQGRAAGPRGPRGSAGFPLAPLLQGSLQSPRRAHLSCLLGLRSLAVLSLARSFTTLMLLESAGCCLVECASVRVCLMVLSGKAEVPLCPLRAARQGHAVPSCPLTARLTSAAWLGGVRQGPPL